MNVIKTDEIKWCIDNVSMPCDGADILALGQLQALLAEIKRLRGEFKPFMNDMARIIQENKRLKIEKAIVEKRGYKLAIITINSLSSGDECISYFMDEKMPTFEEAIAKAQEREEK